MPRLDELHLACPFYSSRQIVRHLTCVKVVVGPYRVHDWCASDGPGGDLPQAAHWRTQTPQHGEYPYLLVDLVINRSDQAWCADSTNIPV